MKKSLLKGSTNVKSKQGSLQFWTRSKQSLNIVKDFSFLSVLYTFKMYGS